jgi:hypothetical protein
MSPLRAARHGLSLTREMVLHGWPRYLRPMLRELIMRPPMKEILPGVHFWTAMHPRIRQPVSSYYLEQAGMLIDPLVPREGLEWFAEEREPQQVVLTNRHHYRQSDRFALRYDCVVRCCKPGLHEFSDGREVEGFAFGEELAPGVTAVQVGAICPDDTALHIATGKGAIAFADGLTRPGGSLAFVPDVLMGDDPAAVKAGLLESFQGLLELEFDALLFAHGEPLVRGGKRALQQFVKRQTRR